MGRKKPINPVEQYRKKQKKIQIQKNKKKKLETRDKILKRKPSTWIQNEIRKISRQGMYTYYLIYIYKYIV